jgi:hypothetical protein
MFAIINETRGRFYQKIYGTERPLPPAVDIGSFLIKLKGDAVLVHCYFFGAYHFFSAA